MEVFYCHSCDEISSNYETISEEECPVCGAHGMLEVLNSSRVMELSNRLLEDLWFIFGDCSYDPNTETTDEDFMDFPVGTHKEEIWHMFDDAYSKGIEALLYM